MAVPEGPRPRRVQERAVMAKSFPLDPRSVLKHGLEPRFFHGSGPKQLQA